MIWFTQEFTRFQAALDAHFGTTKIDELDGVYRIARHNGQIVGQFIDTVNPKWIVYERNPYQVLDHFNWDFNG